MTTLSLQNSDQIPNSEQIIVAVVDPHTLLRESLRNSLQAIEGFKISWTADSAESALAKIVESTPDVVLIDVDLPGECAFELSRSILSQRDGAKILFLTNNSSNTLIDLALKSNVHGYLLKTESLRHIQDSIKRVVSGASCFSDPVRKRLRFDPAERRYRLSETGGHNRLTHRQLQILRHLADGASVKQVAKFLNLSEKSVDSHKYRIMKKLKIHDRVELARYAIREGLTSPFSAPQL